MTKPGSELVAMFHIEHIYLDFAAEKCWGHKSLLVLGIVSHSHLLSYSLLGRCAEDMLAPFGGQDGMLAACSVSAFAVDIRLSRLWR